MQNFYGILAGLLLVFSSAIAEDNPQNSYNFEEKIEAFILNNPEIILESLKRFETKIKNEKKIAEEELIKNELVLAASSGFDYIGGNPNGSLTMVEFIDYKCGYCKKMHNDLKHLLRKNSEVRFIIKEFPILGEQSLLASKASVAMLLYHGNTLYESFTQKLIEYSGTIDSKTIIKLVELSGGDPTSITQAMESESIFQVTISRT